MLKPNRARAVFFDRDGVLNPAVSYPEWGADSPAHPDDLTLYPDAAMAIRNVRAAGYIAVLVSNQPGVAKGKYGQEIFEAIDRRLSSLLARAGTHLDARFYCFHHPNAVVPEYRVACNCRKPKPGLLWAAAEQFNLEMEHCYLIGDSAVDVLAARAGGCIPYLLQRDTDPVNDLSVTIPPVHVVRDLQEAVRNICQQGATNVA